MSLERATRIVTLLTGTKRNKWGRILLCKTPGPVYLYVCHHSCTTRKSLLSNVTAHQLMTWHSANRFLLGAALCDLDELLSGLSWSVHTIDRRTDGRIALSRSHLFPSLPQLYRRTHARTRYTCCDKVVRVRLLRLYYNYNTDVAKQ